MSDLERVLADADAASVELHAAMLAFDTQLGLLRLEVQEIHLREQGLNEIGGSLLPSNREQSIRHDVLAGRGPTLVAS